MMVNLPCLKGSCPNFLRPTYSYTECQPSFLTGSCPTERTPAGYSSCFYLIIYRPSSVSHSTVFSGRSAMFPYVGLGVDALPSTDASFSDFFPEPCPTPEYSDSRQGPGIVIRSAFYGLCCTYLFLYRTSYVFQHFLRIITPAGPQNGKDHTQYLAGYHNQ